MPHLCSDICKQIRAGSRAHWNSLTHIEQAEWKAASHSWWKRLLGYLKRVAAV